MKFFDILSKKTIHIYRDRVFGLIPTDVGETFYALHNEEFKPFKLLKATEEVLYSELV